MKEADEIQKESRHSLKVKSPCLSSSSFVSSLLSDNESLASDRLKFQEELLNKDKICNQMEEKLDTLQTQLVGVSNENKAMAHRLSDQENNVEKELKDKLSSYVHSAKKMDNEMKSLQCYVETLQKEVARLKQEKSKDAVKPPNDTPEEAINEIKFNRIKTQYETLQCEYQKKEKECEDLTTRMKVCLSDCNESREKATNEALRKRAEEMVKEIEENKIFIRELQRNVEVYREKFMKGMS